MAHLPVESVIHARQSAYYAALAAGDAAGAATPFVDFMLTAIRDALQEALATDPVGDPVNRLLQHLALGPQQHYRLTATGQLRLR